MAAEAVAAAAAVAVAVAMAVVVGVGVVVGVAVVISRSKNLEPNHPGASLCLGKSSPYKALSKTLESQILRTQVGRTVYSISPMVD